MSREFLISLRLESFESSRPEEYLLKERDANSKEILKNYGFSAIASRTVSLRDENYMRYEDEMETVIGGRYALRHWVKTNLGSLRSVT